MIRSYPLIVANERFTNVERRRVLLSPPEGLGVFCSRNGAFPSLRIIFPGLVFSVSGFGFLFLDLGFWFPAVFSVPLPVLFLPRRLFTTASNKIGR